MRYSYLLHPLDRFWVVVDARHDHAIDSVHSSETSAAAAAMTLEQDWRLKAFGAPAAPVRAA